MHHPAKVMAIPFNLATGKVLPFLKKRLVFEFDSIPEAINVIKKALRFKPVEF